MTKKGEDVRFVNSYVTSINVGSEVSTTYGMGKILDVVLKLEKDKEGKISFAPPMLKVKTDSKVIVLPFYEALSKESKPIWRAPAKMLWPNHVKDKVVRQFRSKSKKSLVKRLQSLFKKKA